MVGGRRVKDHARGRHAQHAKERRGRARVPRTPLALAPVVLAPFPPLLAWWVGYGSLYTFLFMLKLA